MAVPIIPPFNPPTRPPSGGGTKPATPALGGSPGLLTSTGGLYGTQGLLLAPYYNNNTYQGYVIVFDPSNFDCEEACEYDYRQELPPEDKPQQGRNVSCHLIILKYRELGIANFSVNLTVYQKTTDTYITRSIPVNIPYVKTRKFPDYRIHTRNLGLNPVVSGERPQVTITRQGSSGPLSITTLVLCGNADEVPQI